MLTSSRRESLDRLRTITIALVVAFILAAPGCKDPDEYNPEEPQYPPPGPPVLLLPYADTNLCCSSPHVPVFVDWTTVSGAEIYEIQTDSTLSWNTAEITRASHPPITIGLYRYAETAPWYVRIRAGSTDWTNYTDWSQSRRFFLRPDP